MAGNPDPVTSIAGIATNDNVSKADFVSFEKGNVRGFTAADVPNYDLAGRNFILVDGAVFSKDTTDTISAAGVSVVIDANGVRFKRNVITGKRIQARVATTANITIATALNNGDTLNGVTLADGDIVLVKNQTAPAENGLYVVAASPARHSDFATYNAHAGALVGVTAGTTDPSTMWFCSANEGGTLGTTAITFGKIAFTPTGNAADLIVGQLPTGRVPHIVAQSDPFPTVPFKPRVWANWSTMHWLDDYFTFTRASTATYFDRAGLMRTAASGVPRFHTIYSSGETGLLIEGARTNLLLRSEEFDNAAWGKGNASISADATIAPDAATTADLIIENSANNTHHVAQSVSGNVTFSYLLSIWLKAGTRSRAIVSLRNAAQSIGIQSLFDLSTGTIVSSSNYGSPTSTLAPVIEQHPNGWFRCIVGGVLNAGGGAETIISTVFMDDGATTSYLGDGASGLYMWGAQLEAGVVPSSYIGTSSAQVTRAADICYRSNDDNIINGTEGTLFAEALLPYSNAAGGAIAALDDVTFNERIGLFQAATTISGFVDDGGVRQATLTGALSLGTLVKVALAVKLNDVSFVFNAGAAATGASATLPTVTRLQIGNTVGGSPAFGIIKRMAYWPRRITNANLQTVTT